MLQPLAWHSSSCQAACMPCTVQEAWQSAMLYTPPHLPWRHLEPMMHPKATTTMPCIPTLNLHMPPGAMGQMPSCLPYRVYIARVLESRRDIQGCVLLAGSSASPATATKQASVWRSGSELKNLEIGKFSAHPFLSAYGKVPLVFVRQQSRTPICVPLPCSMILLPC